MHFLRIPESDQRSVNQNMVKKKIVNSWKLNSMLLNEEYSREEIKEEILKFLENNEDSNPTCQNLWDCATQC